MKIERVESDILVIGSGIAGLQTALEAGRLRKRVIIVSKSPVGKANNTYFAGGGFTFATQSFTRDEHIQQTFNSGRKINDQALVACMANAAPDRVKALIDMGLEGDFRKNGFWCQSSTLVGGTKISGLMVRACRETGIQFLDNVMITDLLVSDTECHGALGFHKRSGKWFGFCAKAVILASGGFGAAYAKSNNAPGATGDGYALALRAGLELRDMEFVQFNAMVYAGSGHSSMIIPSVFADLGDILNRRGEDIKAKYGLNEKPIAVISRDRFAQAMLQEVRQGNSMGGALLLDLRKMDEKRLPYGDHLKAHFKRRISWNVEPVKITQACHHTMGGVCINADSRTALKGLYAAGEVTGGTHGANRMGGNALSDGLVFGTQAARSASRDIGSASDLKDFDSLVKSYTEKWKHLLDSDTTEETSVNTLLSDLKQILWKEVGIIRNGPSIKHAIERMEKILHLTERTYAGTPTELRKLVECRNMAIAGMATAVSALKREESRGSHFREDFSTENRHWLKHIHIRWIDGKPTVRQILS